MQNIPCDKTFLLLFSIALYFDRKRSSSVVLLQNPKKKNKVKFLFISQMFFFYLRDKKETLFLDFGAHSQNCEK